MSPEDRAAAIQSLGYAPRQAAFLALAAVHGGYFLRRHYAAFLERRDGGVVTDLLRRVVVRGHAVRQRVARDTHIYHLCARPIYAAIGEHDSRFRRPALPATVGVRLMTLDLVLGWRDRTVLATEADKVQYFTDAWGIPRSTLPAACYRSGRPDQALLVRYFVDHAPIALTHGSPEVTFAHLQGWSRGVGGFETFLTQHRPLFRALPEVRVVYATTRAGLVVLAQRTWTKVLGEANSVGLGTPTPEQLAAHFRLRQRLDQHGAWGLSDAERARYEDDERRFTAAEWQPWYVRWCAIGDVALEPLRRPVVPARTGPPPRFEALVLRRWYPLFPPNEARHDTHRTAA